MCWISSIQMYISNKFSISQYLKIFFFSFFISLLCSLCISFFLTPGPPIITVDATQHAVKHSKGKLECWVGSSPTPDKIVSEPCYLYCASFPCAWDLTTSVFLPATHTHASERSVSASLPLTSPSPFCTNTSQTPRTLTNTYTHIFTAVIAATLTGKAVEFRDLWETGFLEVSVKLYSISGPKRHPLAD